MKKWTRILALVLAVVLCLGTLAGCGNSSADTGKEPAKANDKSDKNDAQETAEPGQR